MRVAAIDCGTNSVRLLVTDFDGGEQHDVERRMRIVRLGQDVDRTGRLAPDALERARSVFVDYAAAIEQLGAERTRLVATSATRDASNRDEFAALVRQTIGVEPEVVTGLEEAQLSFTGAASVMADSRDVLVVDIGGGSTEFVRSRPGHELQSISIDMGAVRMTERHLRTDPPSAQELGAMGADIARGLDDAGRAVELAGATSVIAVAGTATTLAAIDLGLTEYDSTRIHGSVLRAASVRAITDRLQHLHRAGRSAIGVIHPGRIDVIIAGATILAAVAGRTGAEQIVISERDILDGIAHWLSG